MKSMLRKYAKWFYLLYFPLYLTAFELVEHHTRGRIHVIESALDMKIPFIEYFIVPYLLWFFYIAAGVLYFLLKEEESYRKLMYTLMTGMTVFILVSMIYPNGLMLRPMHFARDNVFVDLTRFLYSIDTSTNVFPSIHVFNSMALHLAVAKSQRLKDRKMIQCGSFLLCVSIILSTMFLKQHSVFDVISGMGLFCVTYMMVYSDVREKVFVGTAYVYNENHK
ncbi:MAG: phosphatase PAP2 family protein [Eubacterium sp.]|nr:phosphatase PAP2 family protein [Eubacterium sp.]